MIPELRRGFNARWTEAGYGRLLEILRRDLGEAPEFRVAETPCFFPASLMHSMTEKAAELTRVLLADRSYLDRSSAAIPARYRVAEPGGVQPPHFMTVDFGFVREATGELGFRLVELQAFPSVFGFQEVLGAAHLEAYDLDPGLSRFLGGHDQDSYWRLLREVLLGGHDPEQVILMEVSPERQKTRVDFGVYEQRLGLRTVDIEQIRQRGERLEYQRDGRWTPVKRIFNRAIADEMERMGVCPGFDLSADLRVEWAGHPNWYFRASKFSLPFLKDPVVPRAVFLGDWLRDPGLLDLPLERTLLKPLFSFAGKGIQFAPTLAELRAIPEAERAGYLLQERVSFEPVIETPYGATQAEVRIMLVWPDGGTLQPVIGMVRLGRGLMMGVDHNRDQAWVGGTAAFVPEGT